MRLLALLLLGASWVWPVSGPHDVVRPYVAPASDYGAGHRGVDLAAPDGVVLAPSDGVVRFAGWVVDRPVLTIDHGGGVLSSYEPVATDLARGDRVSPGQVLGSVHAGHCSMLCVHVGVRVHGEYVSPLRFLGGVPRAVLLPTRPIGGATPSGAPRGRSP